MPKPEIMMTSDQYEIARNYPGAECRPGSEQMKPARRPEANFVIVSGSSDIGYGSTERDAWQDATDRRREKREIHQRYREGYNNKAKPGSEPPNA